MNHRLTAADVSAPIQLNQSNWRRSVLAKDLGACHIDSLRLDSGLLLVYVHYQSPYQLIETSFLERDTRSLTLSIGIEGQSSTIGIDGNRFDFIAGHSTIAAYTNVRGERRFPANQSIKQLRLIAEESILHKYGLDRLLDGISNDQTAKKLFFGRYNGATQRMADSLIHLHDCAGSLLDLQIAALSLLAEQTRHFLSPATLPGKLRSDDQDKMLRARDIMMRQFHLPLTIAYLCSAVGTNEFKLKQGFREYFGTSPYRMLTDIRMKKAWELLESGLHVSTVAYKVGYQHLSSFSAAFARYHSKTPKAVAAKGK